MDDKRFEIRSPAIWNTLSYEESTYDEVIKINKGIGYTNNENSANRLAKDGYTVTDSHNKKFND